MNKSAELIKKMLLNYTLQQTIEIKKRNMELKINQVSINSDDNKWGDDEFFLMLDDSDMPLKVKNNYYYLSIKVGWWSDTYEIKDAHIILESNSTKLGLFFCQLEFSQAIEDD